MSLISDLQKSPRKQYFSKVFPVIGRFYTSLNFFQAFFSHLLKLRTNSEDLSSIR